MSIFGNFFNKSESVGSVDVNNQHHDSAEDDHDEYEYVEPDLLRADEKILFEAEHKMEGKNEHKIEDREQGNVDINL